MVTTKQAGIIALFIYALMIVVCRYYPDLGEDEGQIVAFGNRLFQPSEYGSVNWDMAALHPMKTLCYLSCGLAEIAWRITGSFWGPRMISTLGIPGIVFSMFLLLRDLAGRATWMTLCISLACALDPFLARLAQSGRMDALAVATVLFSAVAARRYVRTRSLPWLGLCGLLLGVSFFVWIRAIVAWPMVLLALLHGRPADWRAKGPDMLWTGVFAALSLVLLFELNPDAPLLSHVFIREQGGGSFLMAKLAACASSASALQQNPFLLSGLALCFLWLVYRLKSSPATFGPVVAAGMLAFAIAVLTASKFHGAHYAYLVPFAGVLLACGLNDYLASWDEGSVRRISLLLTAYMAAMLAWNLSSSGLSKLLKMRPVAAHGYPLAETVLPALRENSHRVLSFDPRLYYALRMHGKSMTASLIGATPESTAALMQQEKFDTIITQDGILAEGQALAVAWAVDHHYQAQIIPGYHLYSRE